MLNCGRALTIAWPSIAEAPFQLSLRHLRHTGCARSKLGQNAGVTSRQPFTLNYGRRSTLHAYHCDWDQVNWHSERRALVRVQIREGQRGVDGAAPMAAREA